MNMKTKANLVAAGVLVAMSANSFGQSIDSPPHDAPESMRGIPGVAARHAVMNFSDLARADLLPQARALQGEIVANPLLVTAIEAGGPEPVPPSPAPADSFSAFEDLGYRTSPDTQGAVGPNHLMMIFNQGVRIQDRAGTTISTVTLSNFWGSLGPFTNTTLYGPVIFDSKVLFDPFGNRWIAVTLYSDVVFGGGVSSNSSVLLGVSQTSDPTGNWNLYRILAGELDLGPDYPAVGFNKDWIVVQANMLRNSSSSFSRSRFHVFNKTNLYAGGPGAFTLFDRFDIGDISQPLPATILDRDVATMYLLGVSGNNGVRIYTITGPVGAEVFGLGATVTAPFSWSSAGFAEILPQLGSSRRIRAADPSLRGVVYRNGSLWAVHAIYLSSGGSTRASVQWWQIAPAGTIVQRGLLDDPTGATFYDYPSLAVNKANDVLIGYSRFSATQYASANYSFRAGTDPPGTLRRDTVLKSGEAPFAKPHFVDWIVWWGDYSATVIDPVNDLDLWTIQEYASTPVEGQDRYGTWWGRITPPNLNLGIAGVTLTEGNTGSTNAVFRVSLSKTNDQTITVDFATADGSARAGQDYIAANGTLVFNPGETNKTITVPVLGDLLDETNETFFVSLSNPTNIVLAYTQAQGTIVDDDPVSSAISINDISVREGDAGLTDATFTLNLSAPSGLPIGVRMTTANGTATLRIDYLPTNIVVTIPPGATSQPVTIKIIGDTLIEPNETFFVNLSSPLNATLANTRGTCTILDDDLKVTAVALFGGNVRLRFTTQTNQAYRVERTDSLATPILWEPQPGATNLPGTGAAMEVLDAGVTNRPQRFYRVGLLP